MSEEQQMVDSTTQLEAPQEIATDEVNVVNESPSEEGGSDNMSLSELTTQLLAKDEEQEEGGETESEETESEETPEETEPSRRRAPRMAATNQRKQEGGEDNRREGENARLRRSWQQRR